MSSGALSAPGLKRAPLPTVASAIDGFEAIADDAWTQPCGKTPAPLSCRVQRTIAIPLIRHVCRPRDTDSAARPARRQPSHRRPKRHSRVARPASFEFYNVAAYPSQNGCVRDRVRTENPENERLKSETGGREGFEPLRSCLIQKGDSTLSNHDNPARYPHSMLPGWRTNSASGHAAC